MRGLCCWLGCDDAVAEAVRLGQFVRRHARRRALLDAAGRSTLQMAENTVWITGCRNRGEVLLE